MIPSPMMVVAFIIFSFLFFIGCNLILTGTLNPRFKGVGFVIIFFCVFIQLTNMFFNNMKSIVDGLFSKYQIKDNWYLKLLLSKHYIGQSVLFCPFFVNTDDCVVLLTTHTEFSHTIFLLSTLIQPYFIYFSLWGFIISTTSKNNTDIRWSLLKI